ncbi:Ocs element-binding factor 1 [Apostasia shenzhenica]|uniref:Ocs element-binding factor 1 n=1 Tax=Apostasia shenzhenica TaxID=1088818 RepID=A0A2I0AMK9_9ASPA|nr:Ocs element-binding factor 1 [Apostasia shenzhenica]
MVSSSGSSNLKNSSSEGDLQALMAERRQKRMISNRESARRSRMRKQKHLDDLTELVSSLSKEKSQILAALAVTTRHCAGMEAENTVLQTQKTELRTRLQSLNEILYNMTNGGGRPASSREFSVGFASAGDDSFLRSWSPLLMNQLTSSLSSDVFLYCQISGTRNRPNIVHDNPRIDLHNLGPEAADFSSDRRTALGAHPLLLLRKTRVELRVSTAIKTIEQSQPKQRTFRKNRERKTGNNKEEEGFSRIPSFLILLSVELNSEHNSKLISFLLARSSIQSRILLARFRESEQKSVSRQIPARRFPWLNSVSILLPNFAYVMPVIEEDGK